MNYWKNIKIGLYNIKQFDLKLKFSIEQTITKVQNYKRNFNSIYSIAKFNIK